MPFRLGVAVSGGSDSLGLLHLLHQTGEFDLHAVTVNHGLRPQSASESLHVARICEHLGLPHDILEWKGWDGRGNLQDQARRNRYTLIADWARYQGLDAVAVGHTLDDQAETFLMRLARSSGVDGLSGMASRFQRDGAVFVRPLLNFRREDLKDYLADQSIRWVDDPSNEEEVYERVRARKALAILAPLGISASELSSVASNLADARDALSAVAADWAQNSVKFESGDLVFDRTALAALPMELQRRVVGGALRFIAGADYPPRREALSQLLTSIGDRENRTLGGCLVMSSDFTVRVTREFAAVSDLESPVDQLWDQRWKLNGSKEKGLTIRALGDGISECPDWRLLGLPRATVLASPAVWQGDRLISAPFAGYGRDWTAVAPGLDAFAASLIAH